jgi:hypothetical protein
MTKSIPPVFLSVVMDAPERDALRKILRNFHYVASGRRGAACNFA